MIIHKNILSNKIVKFIITISVIFIILALFFVSRNPTKFSEKPVSKGVDFNENKLSQISPTESLSPTPTPTPKPLSFSEMQKLYGPCTKTPVLLYHHIQSSERARLNNQISLTVFTDYFEKQMAYLKEKGYQIVTMNDLNNFFLGNVGLPPKSIILTFDDGYQDFYSDAYPILKNYGFKATAFLPTGLMDNPGYLTWNEIEEMSQTGLIYFGNHTWSHHSTATDKLTVEKEINTAQLQLSERGLNMIKVFAYPYGADSTLAKDYLNLNNYNLGFTVHHANILCLKQRLDLPRIRIGNSYMQNYGF
jgi:peptidoglycan/xylan/chitin deacetylase (PgdA/CDA1 family)